MSRLENGSTCYCQDDALFDALLLIAWSISFSRAKIPRAILLECLPGLDEASLVR